MTTFLVLIVIFLLVLVLGFAYRAAKSKQRVLREKARADYADLCNAIRYWNADRGNEKKANLALIALAMYSEYERRVRDFPVTYKHQNAEAFESLDEWRNIFLEEEAKIKNWLEDGDAAADALAIKEAISELRQMIADGRAQLVQ
jgi:hypothetical protein